MVDCKRYSQRKRTIQLYYARNIFGHWLHANARHFSTNNEITNATNGKNQHKTDSPERECPAQLANFLIEQYHFEQFASEQMTNLGELV